MYKVQLKANMEYKQARIAHDNYLIQVTRAKRERVSQLVETAYRNKDLYEQHSKEEIRRMYYNNGVTI